MSDARDFDLLVSLFVAKSISFQAKNGRRWSSYVLRLISPTRQHRDEHNRIDVTFCIVTSHDRVPRVNALSSSDVVIASYQNDPNPLLLPRGFLWSIVPSLLDRRATPLFESDRGVRGGSPCKRKIRELHKQPSPAGRNPSDGTPWPDRGLNLATIVVRNLSM